MTSLSKMKGERLLLLWYILMSVPSSSFLEKKKFSVFFPLFTDLNDAKQQVLLYKHFKKTNHRLNTSSTLKGQPNYYFLLYIADIASKRTAVDVSVSPLIMLWIQGKYEESFIYTACLYLVQDLS